MEAFRTTCCVVGGGPAGVMLGYLLARSGVEVVVLEKHGDFFRDFRGDTVHPSTLELMRELGLLEDLLKVPHQKVTSASALIGDYDFRAADFTHLPTHCKFAALMPQWDFLNFLSDRAKRFASFQLWMQNEATSLVQQGSRITGVVTRSALGEFELQADLVVACDGRHSEMRKSAGLPVQEFGVPIDVLWFRISRHPGDPQDVLGHVNYGKALVLINRGEYFQAGLIIRKGSFETLQQAGLEAFQQTIARIAPFLADRVGELSSWDHVKLLTVQINRVRQWHRPGLLCIGDAAHAMSPAGGVGINLAIQDAVAAANILTDSLRQRWVTDDLLARVQRRREFPTRVIQMLQVAAHKGFEAVFQSDGKFEAPWQIKAADLVPGRKWVTGYIIGVGVRPEHVKTEEEGEPRKIWSLRNAAVSAGAFLGALVATTRALRFT